MVRTRIVFALTVISLVVFGGCEEQRTIVGRWKANTSTYYFRDDGILFYRSSEGNKYSGRYYVDESVEPMDVQARLHPMNGEPGTLNVKLQVQFLTADRMRVDLLDGRRGNRVLILTRVTDQEMQSG